MSKLSTEELFELIIHRIDAYLREKRASTQPDKLRLQQKTDGFVFDPNDERIREALVEHVGLLPILATTIYPHIQNDDIDLGQALIMLAIHDIGETITGDTITFLKKDDAEEEEQKIALELLESVYHDAYNGVEHPKTPTERFAKSMDKFIGDILDYLTPSELTLQRYKKQVGIDGSEAIRTLKKEHKEHYFTWNKELQDLFNYSIDKLVANLRNT